MVSRFPDANAALEYLFASFTSRFMLHQGKHDQEFRRPEVLIDLAKTLNVLPSPSRTCLVTGSKGKGTVARLIAWNLAATGLRVGLVVTPEEVQHLDRIRINNQAIPERDFCRILALLHPLLEEELRQQPADFYFSPTGMFLLVALVWFQEQGVNTWVIEGGRGVKYDEIGQIDAAVGVVTNVLPEHLARIGPAIEDVAADKLSLANRCQYLISPIQTTICSDKRCKTAVHPQWFDELNAIAHSAAQHLGFDSLWQPFATPAFFFAHGGILDGSVTPGTVCCDAAIHPDCLDTAFLRQTGLAAGAALIGLSADKEGQGIVTRLTDAGFRHFYTVALSSRIGHIRAWQTANGSIQQVAEMDVISDSDAGLQNLIGELAHKHTSLYIVGVQLFIRSIRQVLRVNPMQPREFA